MKFKEKTKKKIKEVHTYLKTKNAIEPRNSVKSHQIKKETGATDYILKKGKELGYWKKVQKKGRVYAITRDPKTKKTKFLPTIEAKEVHMNEARVVLNFDVPEFGGLPSDVQLFNELMEELLEKGKDTKGFEKIAIRAAASRYWTSKEKLNI